MSGSTSVVVGPYQLEDVIGSGGMGKVYRAYDRRLDRHVAVKQLRPDRENNSRARKRLRREARAVAALGHPAIVQVFDIVEEDAGDWIVMELVGGSSLAQRLHRGPLSVHLVIELARDLAEGLAYAHDQGFIHRDLKTENVMVNELDRAKILDFGLAKRTIPVQDESSLTLDGAVLGTLRSMSPEQAKGYEVDARSDLFSLGTLLYECLTAVSPFKGHNSLETLNRVCTYRQEPVQELRQEIPRNLSDLVDRLLEKLPEHRPPSARQVADELRIIDRKLEREDSDSRHGGTDERETVNYGPTIESATDSASFEVRPGLFSKRTIPQATMLVAVLATVGAALPWLWELTGKQDQDNLTTTPAAVGMRPDMTPATLAEKQPIRLVVLPFESLGPQDNAYFASGITEEISRRLALISGLGIISRTSAARYAGAGIEQIGRELEVEYVLEGTVNWPPTKGDSGKIRITPRLIRVADDIQIWADVFERHPDDFLQVQSEIAGGVAAKLDLTLQSAENRALEARGTRVPAAYNAYLRGLYHGNQPEYSNINVLKAVRMFAHAVAKDEMFTEAYVELSRGHSILHFNNESSQSHRQQAEAALRRAQSLAAELPSVRLATAYFMYYVERDLESASREFRATARYLPHNAEVLTGLGRIELRQGDLLEGAKLLAESFSLDRANARLAHGISEVYRALRDYETADHWLTLSLDLAPDLALAVGDQALGRLAWKGCPEPLADIVRCSTETARQILVDSPIRDDPALYRYWLLFDLYNATLSSREVATRIYSSAADRMHAHPNRPGSCLYFWHDALVLERLGQRDKAMDLVYGCRDKTQKVLDSRSESTGHLGRLGIALAYLGLEGQALAYGDLAVQLASSDHFSGPRSLEYLAIIQVLLGQHEPAIETLENLVNIPYRESINPALLHLDPIWDPLRGSPRFQRLLGQTSKRL